MRSLLFLYMFFVLLSCGQKHLSVKYGKTTKASLISMQGPPLKEEASVLFYPNDLRFQVESNIVTTGFRTPHEEEKELLYWQRRFKECETYEKKISPEERELGCPKAGVSVVYVGGSEFVSRVVEYEK